MRSPRLRKRLMISFFLVSALLLLLINALLLWVMTGPRSLELVTPYIESALSASDNTYHVRIGATQLVWEGWNNPISLHIRDVKVEDDKSRPIARFPDIGIRANLLKLLWGRLDVKSVELNNPVVLLTQGEDGSIAMGFTEPQESGVEEATPEPAPGNSVAAALAAFSQGKEDSPITRLKSITIRHSKVFIRNKRSGVFFRSQEASLEIRRLWGQATGTLVVPIDFNGKAGRAEVNLVVNGNDSTISAKTSFSNVPSALLFELFPRQTWMKSVNIPLSGNAAMQANFDGHVSSLAFEADAGPGAVSYPSEFDRPLDIRKIHLEGELTDSFKALKLARGVLDFGAVSFGLDGFFRREGEEYAIDARVQSQHIPINELGNYWPRSLSPHTRAWVMERIHEGEIEKADVAIHFKPGELALKETPRDAIHATLDLRGATVLYMPKDPPVKNIAGRLEFTGNSMDATVTGASYLSGSRVTAATIRFPDLNAHDVQMFLDMDVTAPAQDVRAFLDLPNLDKAKKLGLTEEISGTASGNAKLDLIAFSEGKEEKEGEVPDINYSLTATLSKVSQPAFLGKHDVSDADMQVEVNNKGLKAEGKAVINALPMSVKAEALFNDLHETRYAIETTMPVARMPDFDLPKLDWVKGSMGVQASFVSSDKQETSKARLDLTRTAIALTDHGYTKKDGVKLALDLETEHLANGNTRVPQFTLRGEGSDAAGSAEIDGKTGDFLNLNFTRLKVGKHDLASLEYATIKGGIDLTAKGRVFDLTPYMNNMSKGGKPVGIRVDVTADRVIMSEKESLYAVAARADCPDICRSAEIRGTLADKTPFTYSISGKGELASQCDNAGALLRALGVYEGMEGGKLSLTGQYQGQKLVGKVLIKEFVVKNAPILTKIFTIASPTGILDTLSGNGIEFDKMVAPYEYEHGNIIVTDAKQYGSALGITASGAISLPTASYDLNGTLVPSYTLNSLVGKIPLVGDILVGGEGKGLIALTYSVKGPMADPSISANPLSVLTPGFLRGVFDIFDKPAPSLEQMKRDQKLAETKAPRKP